jgi:hypothetical protein
MFQMRTLSVAFPGLLLLLRYACVIETDTALWQFLLARSLGYLQHPVEIVGSLK